MRKTALFAIVLLALLVSAVRAYAVTYTCPPYPFTFPNGTIADGTQVNANFNSIAACVNNAPFGSGGGGGSRAALTAVQNLYVATTGIDTGGCASAGSPCLTLQYAANQAILNYDQKGFAIFINVADGNYSSSSPIVSLNGPQVGAGAGQQTTPASIWFIGDVANPDNVVVTSNGGPATFLMVGAGLNVVIEGMKIVSTHANLVFTAYHAVVALSAVDLGNTGGQLFGMMHPEDYSEIKVVPAVPGGVSLIVSGSGSGGFIQACCTAKVNFIEENQVIKIVGNLTFNAGFIGLGMGSDTYINSNFVSFDLSAGSVIGPKYSISTNSTLWTQSGNWNTYLPGSLPGISTTTGNYRPEGATSVDGRVGLNYLNAVGIGPPLFLWVSPTGHDTTDCQAVTLPCLTIQYAVDQALIYYDGMGIAISIRVNPGTYTAPTVIAGPQVGIAGPDPSIQLFINGLGGVPDNVIISTASTAFTVSDANVSIQGLKITTSGGDGILAQRGGQVSVTSDDFGAVAGAQLHADSGAQIIPFGAYTISGSATSHFWATNQGRILCLSDGPNPVTLTGTLTFAEFALAKDLSLINCSSTANSYTGGSVSGSSYFGAGNSVFDTAGGASNFFPGSSPGTLLTGSQYF